MTSGKPGRVSDLYQPVYRLVQPESRYWFRDFTQTFHEFVGNSLTQGAQSRWLRHEFQRNPGTLISLKTESFVTSCPTLHHKVHYDLYYQRESAGLEPQKKPQPLNVRAEGDLKLIRSMMQRTLRIVPLPGWGLATIGLIGLCTGWITRGMGEAAWLTAWLASALLASAVAVVSSTWQFRRTGRSLFTGNGRRFWLSLAPGFLGALCLTWLLDAQELWAFLPALWLLLYGVSLLAASAHSVSQIFWMGWTFLVLGIAALVIPYPDFFMTAGFGGLHLLYGFIVLRTDNDS